MISKIDIIQMDFIMRHIDIFAWSLGVGKKQRKNEEDSKEFFHDLKILIVQKYEKNVRMQNILDKNLR